MHTLMHASQQFRSNHACRVFLYEVYTNAAAFAAHLDSLHFKEFDSASASIIASKRVKTYDELAPAAR